MKCTDIEKHLSAYIDDELDAPIRLQVANHLSECRHCSEILESLEGVASIMGAQTTVYAPADFLDKLHERIQSESSLKKFFRTLFVPFKIKIPLEFATTAALCFLIFFVVNSHQQIKEVSLPVSKNALVENAEKRAPKTDTDLLIKDEAKSEPVMYKAMPQSAPVRRKATIELAFLMPAKGLDNFRRGASLGMEVAAEYDKQVVPVVKSKQQHEPYQLKGLPSSSGNVPADTAVGRYGSEPEKMRLSEETILKKESLATVSFAEDIVTRVKVLVGQVDGSILSVDDSDQTGRPRSLQVEIPASVYEYFIVKLQHIADFQTPPPEKFATELETIRMMIRFAPFH
jgi:hypothetical protein